MYDYKADLTGIGNRSLISLDDTSGVWVFSEPRTGEPVKRELFANSDDDWPWHQWSRDTWFAEYQWPSRGRDSVNSKPQMANSLHQSPVSVNSKSMWERSVFNIILKTQLNEPPTKVSGLQGEKSWKLIRIPDPWKDSQVFFWNFQQWVTSLFG